VRIHRLGTFGPLLGVLAAGALVGGCADDTVLRLTVLPGALPKPAALRVTVAGAGLNAPPRRVAPVTLPGTVVVRGLPAGTSSVCVAVDGLDGADGTISQGSTTVTLAAHHTTNADVTLGAPTGAAPCEGFAGDLGTPGDDLGGDGDLARVDGGAEICPAGAIFCDDFESGDTSKWDVINIKKDLGSQLGVQSARVYHGTHALESVGSGASGADNFVAVEKRFPPTSPPFAIRGMFFSAQNPHGYTLVMTVFDDSGFGVSFGGDNDTTWVITEERAGGTDDHHSDMATADAGRWHCLEIVVDAAGNVTGYVDEHPLIGPFARVTPTQQYTTFIVGISRTVVANVDVFFDDVAMGPSRLYCP
jgi:hypothetical protein